MVVMAIDPGPKQSAYVTWNGSAVLDAKIVENGELLQYIVASVPHGRWGSDPLVIEWIESYGMAVGKEVFETCRWCGKYEQAYRGPVHYLTRKQVKLHHCQTTRANDSNIRQALIDRFGEPGTKKAPGRLYGLKKDMWSAMAIAVTWLDQENTEGQK